jgi:archaellum component FlaC
MTKIQSVLAAFSGVETVVNKINSKVTGLDELIKKIETTKISGLISLDKTMQTLVESNIKKYKKLQTLSDELTKQKTYVVGQYQMDLDEYVTNNLQSRYNRSQFVALKNDIAAYKAKYYTVSSQLNCTNLLSTTDESAALLARIHAMKLVVDS